MADKRRDVRKKAMNLNSQWLQNTLKSMGVAGTKALQELMPATSETISSGTKLATDAARTMRQNRAGENQISNALKNNQVVKFGQDFFKNAIEDIKSGNIYNTERDPYSNGDMDMDGLDTMFDDIDTMYGEDEQPGDVTVNNNIVSDGGTGDATLKAIQQQSEYTVKSAKATVDTMVSLSTASIMKTNELGTKMLSELSAINTNLASIIEYNNTNMTKFIEASIGYYEQMSTAKEEESSSTTVSGDNIYGTGGGIDFSSYKEYVKGNIEKLKNESMIGGTLSMILENKDLLITNPLGTVLSGVMKAAIPTVLKDSMEALDRSVQNFIPTILERIGELGDTDEGGLLGMAKQSLGKLFGVKTERKDKFDFSKVEKGPIPYNGVANHTIVEIIPKYLRESNTYLREIAEAVTGKSNSAMSENFVGFDWETGEFKNVDEIRGNAYQSIYDEIASTFGRSDFGKKLASKVDLLESEDDQDKYSDALDQLYNIIERQNGQIAYNDPEVVKELVSGITSSDSIKNLIEATLNDMAERGDGVLGDAHKMKIKSTRSANNMLRSMEQSPLESNLGLMQGQSFDEFVAAKISKSNATVSEDSSIVKKANVSVPSLLQGIQDTLNRGIYVKLKSSLDIPGDSSGDSTNDADVAVNSTQTPQSISDFKAKLAQQAESEHAAEIEETTSTDDDGMVVSVGKAGASKLNTFRRVLDGIMAGNADAAWDQFIAGIGGVFEKASGFLAENFLNPIKTALFGDKDENGYLHGGLFEGVNNRMKESFFSLRRMITGKGYTDAEGNRIEDANQEEMQNTVVGKLRNMANNLRDGIKAKLFGTKGEEGEDGEEAKEGIMGKAKKGLVAATSSLYKGLTGWKRALFGKDSDKDEDEEEAGKKTWENLKEKAKDVLPSALTGSIVGAGGGMMAGGLLGTLVGGPIGGALLGFAGGIASKSDKFQNWLFGDKDENGERTGGIISKKMQDYMKKNGAIVAGGAAIGAVKGAITGGGLLGTIVGGPLAGALTGAITTMVVKSDMFQKFLFGDEEIGSKGLVNVVKGWFGKFGLNTKGNADGGKLAGMLGIGAGVGALSLGAISKAGILGLSLGPAGPIGGALLGLGVGMLAQKDNFKEWLFGKTDENGERREGVLGQFKNTLVANVFTPIKNTMLAVGDDFKTFIHYDVLEKFNIVADRLGSAFFGAVGTLTGKAMESMGDLHQYIKEDFLKGFVQKLGNILSPITAAVSTVGKGIYEIGKRVAAAPLNIMYAITSPIATAIGNAALKTVQGVATAIDWAVVKPVKNLVLKPLGVVVKGLGKVVAAPFKLLGNTAKFISDKVAPMVAHITKFATTLIGDAFGLITKPFRWLGDQVKHIGATVKQVLVGVKDKVVETVTKPFKMFGDFVKDKITDITGYIKQKINNMFKGVLGLITAPFRLIGKGIAKVLGIGKDNRGGGVLGYFKEAWRRSDPNTYTKKDGDDVNTIDKNRKNKAKEEYANNKKRNKERRLNEANQKIMLKATGGQRVLDTEENRKIAEAMAGKPLKWKTKEAPDAKANRDKQKLTTQQYKNADTTARNTTSIKDTVKNISGSLSKIADFLFLRDTNTYKNYSEYKEYRDKAKYLSFNQEETKTKRGTAFVTDAAILHPETSKGDFEKLDSDAQKALQEEKRKNREKRIAEARANIDAHATGTTSAKRGLAIVGENGPEGLFTPGAKSGMLVGLGGPEIINLRGGEKIIPNNKIGGSTDSTVQYSQMSDGSLMKTSNSERLSLPERILRELFGIKDLLGQSVSYSEMEAEYRESNDDEYDSKSNTAGDSSYDSDPDYDSTNIDSIKGGIKNFGRRLVNMIPGSGLVGSAIRGTKTLAGAGQELATIAGDKIKRKAAAAKDKLSSVGELLSTKFRDKENAEREAKEKSKQALGEVTSKTSENERARRAAEKEEDSDDAREDAKLQTLKNLLKGQSEHSSIWNSIFSKKGLLTVGAIAAFGLLKSFLNGGLSNIISNILPNIALDIAGITIRGLGKAFKGLATIGKGIGKVLKGIWKVGKFVGKGIKGAIGGVKKVLTGIGSRVKGIWKKIFGDKADDAAKEITEEAAEKAGKKAGKKFGKETAEATIKDSADDGLETIVKENADDVAEGTAKNQKKPGILKRAWNKLTGKNATKTAGKAAITEGSEATLKDAGETVVKGSWDSNGNYISKEATDKAIEKSVKRHEKKLAKKGMKKTAEATIKNSADDVVKDVVKNNIDNVAESTAKGGLLDNVIGMFKKFIDLVAGKLAKKSGKKVGAGIFKTLSSKVIACLTKHFPKIMGRIAALTAKTAVLVGTVIGYAVDQTTWITLGALNGLSGAKRLFQTDKVDSIMIMISTAIGAFNGSSPGQYCDIINELVATILGIDIYHELACIAYSYIAGEEKADILEGAQKKFKEKYEEDLDAELKTQYDTMIGAGLLDSNVSFEDYKAGVDNGEYAASVKTFKDYNEEKHKSLGAVVGGGVGKAFKGTKDFLFGKDKITYTDDNGNTYTKKEDGTYSVTDSSGKELGYVDEAAIPENAVKNVERTEGLGGKAKNAGKAVVDGVKNAGATIKDISSKAVDGAKNLGSKVVNGAKDLGSKAVDGAKNAGATIMNLGSKAVDGAKDLGSKAVDGAKNVGATIMNLGSKAVDGAKDLGSKAINGAKDLGSKVKDGIGNAIGNIGDAFSNFVDFRKDMASKNIDYLLGKTDSIEYGNSEDGMSGPLNAVAKINQFTLSLPRGIIKFGKGIGSFIGKSVKAIKNVFNKVAPPAKDYLLGNADSIDLGCPENNPGKPIIGVIEKIMQFGLGYPRGIIAAGKGIGKFIGKAVKGSKKLFPKIISEGKNYLLGDSDSINLGDDKDGTSAPISFLGKLMQYGLNIPRGVIATGKGIGKFIGKAVKGAKKLFPKLVSEGKNYILGKNDSIDLGDEGGTSAPISFLGKMVQFGLSLPRGVISAGKGIGKFIGKSVDSVKDFGSGMIDASKKYIFGESKSISAKVSDDNPLKPMVSVVSKVLEIVLFPARLIGKVIGKIKKTLSDVKDTVSGAIDTIKDTGSDIIDGAKDKLGQAGESISGAWNFLTGGGEGHGRKTPQFIGGSGEGTSEPSSLNGVPYYSQNDSRWANKKFVKSDGTDDGATMSSTGCGPTAMSMVISDMTKQNTSPVDLARYAQATGTRDDTGTNQAFIGQSAAAYGIGSKQAYNPDGNYIASQLANGNPMVLLGQSGGGSGSPYTDSGHYIVATGIDSDGKVSYNDPRGKSFSGKMDANQLANSTTSVWSFNKGGKGKSSKPSIINRRRYKGGKGGDNFTAQDVITVAANEIGYIEKASNSDLDSKTGNPGQNNYTKYERDVFGSSGSYWCASFVSWCFYTAANKNKTKAKKVLGELSRACETIRQKFISNKRYDKNPQPGDCIFFTGTRHSGANHIGIVESVSNGKVNTIEGNTGMGKGVIDNGGGVARKTYDVNYKSILGYGHPNYDGSSNFGGVTSSNTNATTSSTSSGGEDILSKASSLMSSFASGMFNAALTGDTSKSWDSIFAGDTSSGDSSGATSSSSGDGSFSSSGGGVEKDVWNYFTNAGYSPATTAGIMGNLAQESGLNPKSIQGNGAGPAAGIAQWENYNTKSSRWKAMSDYASKKGKDWTDLGSQLEFMNKEINTNDFALRVSGKLAPSNLEKAGTTAGTSFDEWKKMGDVDKSTRLFEGAFERAGKPMMDNRIKAANKYYKKYSGGGSGEGVTKSAPTVQTKRYGEPVSNQNEYQSESFVTTDVAYEANNIDKSAVSGGNVSNVEKLLTEMINILGTISTNSGNLSLLSDIKNKIGNGNANIINTKNTTVNNSSSGASKVDTTQNMEMSNSERTARRIALGT